MSSLAEIEEAFEALPLADRQRLLTALQLRVEKALVQEEAPRYLANSKYPPLEGGPSDLSMNTRERARAAILKKFDAEHC